MRRAVVFATCFSSAGRTGLMVGCRDISCRHGQMMSAIRLNAWHDGADLPTRADEFFSCGQGPFAHRLGRLRAMPGLCPKTPRSAPCPMPKGAGKTRRTLGVPQPRKSRLRISVGQRKSRAGSAFSPDRACPGQRRPFSPVCGLQMASCRRQSYQSWRRTPLARFAAVLHGQFKSAFVLFKGKAGRILNDLPASRFNDVAGNRSSPKPQTNLHHSIENLGRISRTMILPLIMESHTCGDSTL